MRLGNLGYSVATGGLQLVDHDPYQNLYSSYHSKSPTNVLNSNDPEMDALIEELRRTPLGDETKEIVHEIETRYQETVPSINYRYYTPTVIWQKDVHGVVGLNEGMADFGKAWIKK